MRIETTARQLHSALSLVSGIVGRKTATPVLGCVRIEGGCITATNLDMAISVMLPTIGENEGAAAVDFFALSALAKHIPADENLSLVEDDGLATAFFNGSRYQMPSYPAADFPDFGEVAGAASRIDNAGLVAAIRRVRFAASAELFRYYLNGVAILLNADGVPMVCATNGHRLAMMPIPAAPEGSVGAIIHKNTATFLARQNGEPTTVVFDRDRCRARFDLAGATLSVKLIDGSYPDVNRVIPKVAEHVFSADRGAMIQALRRLRSFTRQGAAVEMIGSASELALSVRSGGRSATETLSFVDAPARDFKCGYNVDYLLEALSAFTGDHAAFAVDGDLASCPALICSQDDDLRIVQMPMSV